MPRRIGCVGNRLALAGANNASHTFPVRIGSLLASLSLVVTGCGLPAVALATTYTVTTLGDPDPVSDLQLSLREAVKMAGNGDTVDFAGGLNGTITLLHGEIPVQQSIMIEGPGPASISIDGNAASRIFNIGSSDGSTLDVTISGLGLTNGRAKGGNGGALVSYATNLTIDHCVITGNGATGTGGGLAINGNNWTIADSLVSGNASGSDGGGLSGFTPYNGVAPSSEVVESSTFIDNTSGADGAAIALSVALIPVGGDPPSGPITITLINSTLARNIAIGAGGGVYANGSASDAMTIASSTIVDNQAGTGGGIDVGGTSVLVDSIVANNATVALSGGDLAGSFNANYNLITVPATAMLTGGHNIIGKDPLLGELGMNGGPTPTFLPTTGSPVIDAGDPAFTSPPEFDQRGLDRVVNSAIDIGSVERQLTEDDVFRDGFEPNP